MATKQPSPKPAAPVAKAATTAIKKPRLGKKQTAKALGLPIPKGPTNRKPSVAGKNQTGKQPRTSTGVLAAGPDDPKYTELTPLVITALLAALAECGRITKVCEDLRLNRAIVLAFKADNKEFRQAYDDSMSKAFVGMEDEVRRRAFNGYEEPVYQGGVLVGTVRKYSDRLAEMMVKAGKPEVYSPKVTTAIEHGGSIAHSFAHLSDDQLNEEINKKLRFLGLLSSEDRLKTTDLEDKDPLAGSPEEDTSA